MAPSLTLDSTVLPDGGTGMVPRQCDAATVSGGRWEAWCSPAGVYLWARFEGLQATGSWMTCPGISMLSVGQCLADEGSGEHGGGGSISPRTDPTYFFDRDMHSTAVVMTNMLDASYTAGGSADFFVTAYHEFLCTGTMPMTGHDADAVIAGVSMLWPM
jgi:hypothetical protein